MYAIALYGVLLIALSLFMVAKPEFSVEMALRYCRLRYMHPAEILVCLGFGSAFIFYSGSSAFPAVLRIFGYLLAGVGIALLLTPPSYHRRLAIWSTRKFARFFRPAGLVSLGFGVLLVYAVL